MSQIVLGVGGGVAAYKSALLLRALTESGHDVRVVPTASALRFVGAATFEALSGNPVSTEVWDDVPEVAHVRIGQRADLVLVNPATADLLARAAAGRADDLLTATLLTAHCPVVFVPAMHTEMWQHPATQDNVATLRRRGAVVLPPAVGRLTGPDSGPGRLPEPADVAALAELVLSAGAGALAPDLIGRRVVISAGGTREPLDPVRFLGNRSSGLQGWALARVAAARGAEVVLVAANVELPAPFGVRVVAVESAEELRTAMHTESSGRQHAESSGQGAARPADVVVMAAAVADFRPATVAGSKLKKGGAAEPSSVELVRNPDVLVELVGSRPPGQLVVGFAAETGDAEGDVLTHARAKLARKGADLLVVNDVSAGRVFGRAENEVTVLATDGSATAVPSGRKDAVAAAIWDVVSDRLPRQA
ncbi:MULTISPECIES: bifunctional phosphopantothenoylcysteine decarboxylase/phosphopantothenate--cysteine ligase CoaBC [unclassified Modestobacter]|uniref:bifunctional phosphopantothenoylcysteine decarboxylase/phosphopantothenate--cysteine ligase CoaBC n=1 Tax=unclassified Modestobacter TaxID=2643866 RepID=UPI0022AAFA3B|nr:MULTISPECIES: bifunctional phosphopantothenoylcysteine decarboxylase/phosphopantothenate--cysteine ligase CoaBC [unclassified Modestobacter]MCZ2824956.1 bifunctional phosphopantothenoylcysteine decarboxylase/phosphopantothenate--cysteine ligase CoaBC [Modestobacter sp. VKM Ac-2981]MCZ2854541.1 bifunctional phosphopantothenoylcysteine decarboxylase/phosphopantothenate--cysteine ligase CoaBC [Modestobacter sp. VKM Ac-2982]